MADFEFENKFPDLNYYDPANVESLVHEKCFRAHAIILEHGKDRSAGESHRAFAHWNSNDDTIALTENQLESDTPNTHARYTLARLDRTSGSLLEAFVFSSSDHNIYHAIGNTSMAPAANTAVEQGSIDKLLRSYPLDERILAKQAEESAKFWDISARLMLINSDTSSDALDVPVYTNPKHKLEQLAGLPVENRELVGKKFVNQVAKSIILRTLGQAYQTEHNEDQPLAISDISLIRHAIWQTISDEGYQASINQPETFGDSKEEK